jgi:hypothetical protein
MKASEVAKLLKISTKVFGIRLPRDIDFVIEAGVLRVFINKPTQNMQTDGAAFEGWILALKSWLSKEIRFVELDFSVPDNLSGRYGNSEVGHYNRFLYRINNLLRLFPSWFSLDKSKRAIVSDFMLWLESNTTLLNHSLRERESVIQTNNTNNMERQIESWLVFEEGKDLLCDLWSIDKNKLFNQLPIGVFYEEIAARNAIFTRGASAVDLWGIGNDEKTLHLIELKCGANKGMGVISETLFYAAILYDTCIRGEELFQFGRYLNTPETKDSIAIKNNDEKFGSLFVHILSEKYHPLFSDRVVLLIQEGLSNLDISFDRATYDYEKKVIFEKTEDMSIMGESVEGCTK